MNMIVVDDADVVRLKLAIHWWQTQDKFSEQSEIAAIELVQLLYYIMEKNDVNPNCED